MTEVVWYGKERRRGWRRILNKKCRVKRINGDPIVINDGWRDVWVLSVILVERVRCAPCKRKKRRNKQEERKIF